MCYITMLYISVTYMCLYTCAIKMRYIHVIQSCVYIPVLCASSMYMLYACAYRNELYTYLYKYVTYMRL